MVKLTYNDQMPWLGNLVQGGLIQPTDEFLVQMLEANRVFQGFHGKTLYTGPNAHNALAEDLFQRDGLKDLGEEVLRAFVDARSKIRLEYVNSKLQRKNLKSELRNLKKVGHHSS